SANATPAANTQRIIPTNSVCRLLLGFFLALLMRRTLAYGLLSAYHRHVFSPVPLADVLSWRLPEDGPSTIVRREIMRCWLALVVCIVLLPGSSSAWAEEPATPTWKAGV